ncbi:MAG TPA: FGGY-family carbohydrate kinase [Candidatus Limnocylindrales bacterium]|nr:FGGY-family carbohydrate kinase [Candidatus Limnocylindrales bacterium]
MTPRGPVLLAIDLGTTQIKVGFVTPAGVLLGVSRSRYPIDVDAGAGRAEQDPEQWWLGLRRGVRELMAMTADRAGEVLGIAVAGHGPTLTVVDEAGRPVRPAVTWLDTRAADEARTLENATGLVGWGLGVLPAALWLERHEPESVAQARWYLNSWDALTLRLSGRAASSILPDQAVPSADTFASTGLHAERVAPPVPVATAVGGLLPAIAGELGLAAGIPVVAGMADSLATFHGARMMAKGDAIDVGGSAGGFGIYWDRRVDAAGSFSSPAPFPGLWSVGGAMAATGSALDWLRNDVLGGASSAETLIQEAAAVPAGADGLVFLPYLAGERSPLWDPSARGAFVGLTLRHGRAYLARAVLEAAALAIRHVAASILEAGVSVTAMRVCGGPAHSETWNQIKADVTGFPVEVPRVLETGLIGAAIVAAVGVGVQPDLPTAIRAMTAIDHRREPDPERHVLYDRVYEAYVGLHPAIAPVLRATLS